MADFDRALRDPADSLEIDPRYHTVGDLHPKDVGYRVMADTVDLAQLKTGATHDRAQRRGGDRADDAGWGDFGYHGSQAIPTQNMDGLARDGVRLTDCHASGAVCTPSRYSLLTGRYGWRGPLKNFVLMGHGPALIEPTPPTLASVWR